MPARRYTSSRIGSALALAALAWALFPLDARAQGRESLESFYATFSNYRIVHVEAVAGGVKIRVIDIDFHDDLCWQRVVRAHEGIVRGSTVAALAATPVCTLSQKRVDRAVERSRERSVRAKYDIPSGVDINTVVAVCGGREQRFVFDSDQQADINGAALKRRDSDVHALWTLGERMAGRVSRPGPDVAAEETLGTAAAADLVAGKYDGAFRDMCWDTSRKRVECSPGFWTQELGTYTGPPAQRGPLPAELADQASWQFVDYSPPAYPPIARSARVHGDVRLRLEVERVSGTVTQAAVIEGQPFLLNDAALSAARRWRFVPATSPAEPFEVTLRFELRCPER